MKGIDYINKYLPYALMAVYASWLIWMVVNNAYLISSPYPIEYREGHSMSSTYLMLKGILPYSFETYPEYYNSYGILYNILMLPFVYIFGNTLVVYRIVNELCVIATILLLLFYKRETRRWEIILAMVCNFYLFYHINTNVSVRPDGLGVLLYMVTIIVPIRNDFSKQSLWIACLFGILAFFTKPYYLLGWYLMSLVLIFKDWKKCIIYNLVFHSLFAIVCIIINLIFPLYFYEVIFAYGSSVGDMHYSINQMIISLKRLSPMLFAVIFACCAAIRSKHNFTWGYLVIFLAIFILLIYPLGTNDGAYLTYHAQLLAPILLAFSIDVTEKETRYKVLLHLGIFICSIYAFIKIPLMHRSADEECWLKIESYVANSHNIYNDSGITPIMFSREKPIVLNGVSDFAMEFETRPITESLFGRDSIVLDYGRRYSQSLKAGYYNNLYDCAIIGEKDARDYNPWMQNYKCVDTIGIVYPCNWPYTYYVYLRN